MASKKKFHLFVTVDEYYGAMEYTESFVSLDKAIEQARSLKSYEDVEIKQTAEDGSLVELCSVASVCNHRYSHGVVYKSGPSGYEIWWAKKGKGENWKELRSVKGQLILIGGLGKKTRQWEVRSEENGAWELRTEVDDDKR